MMNGQPIIQVGNHPNNNISTTPEVIKNMVHNAIVREKDDFKVSTPPLPTITHDTSQFITNGMAANAMNDIDKRFKGLENNMFQTNEFQVLNTSPLPNKNVFALSDVSHYNEFVNDKEPSKTILPIEYKEPETIQQSINESFDTGYESSYNGDTTFDYDQMYGENQLRQKSTQNQDGNILYSDPTVLFKKPRDIYIQYYKYVRTS